MSRKKITNSEDLLSHNIIIRVPENLFKKLEDLKKKSRSASIAEVCQRILSNRQIRTFDRIPP